LKRGEAAIWQRRFWEHTIRDEADLNRHRDYIHFNPVKHGLVDRVCAWRWSSFHRYVRMGLYDMEWGQGVDEDVNRMQCGE
jgi:putative transposase